jgi:agmatine/peptidylarginine deiminase
VKQKTPAALGYRMPAEWEKHEATWVAWPKYLTTFPKEILPKVEATYVRMVEALGRGRRFESSWTTIRWRRRSALFSGKVKYRSTT